MKPLPARTFVWYLWEGHLTTGRRGPAAGLGAMERAFLTRVVCLRYLRAGWLNHVLTYRCQSLWKWPLGIILFLLGAMVTELQSWSLWNVKTSVNKAMWSGKRKNNGLWMISGLWNYRNEGSIDWKPLTCSFFNTKCTTITCEVWASESTGPKTSHQSGNIWVSNKNLLVYFGKKTIWD